MKRGRPGGLLILAAGHRTARGPVPRANAEAAQPEDCPEEHRGRVSRLPCHLRTQRTRALPANRRLGDSSDENARPIRLTKRAPARGLEPRLSGPKPDVLPIRRRGKGSTPTLPAVRRRLGDLHAATLWKICRDHPVTRLRVIRTGPAAHARLWHDRERCLITCQCLPRPT
jgi:hypothetical protein